MNNAVSSPDHIHLDEAKMHTQHLQQSDMRLKRRYEDGTNRYEERKQVRVEERRREVEDIEFKRDILGSIHSSPVEVTFVVDTEAEADLTEFSLPNMMEKLKIDRKERAKRAGYEEKRTKIRKRDGLSLKEVELL